MGKASPCSPRRRSALQTGSLAMPRLNALRTMGVTGKRENREIGVRNERYKAGSRIVVPNWVKPVSCDVSVSGSWP